MTNRKKTGHLNPNIPSPELARLLTSAAAQRESYGVRLLTPQLLLAEFLRDDKASAHLILRRLHEQRGFDWDDLTRRVDMMARSAAGRDANFNFTDDFGKDVPLADELLITVDEALTIAQARDELNVTSAHTLAAMADAKVTTYAVLQRIGVTQAAVVALFEEMSQDGSVVIRDYIDEAQKGSLEPTFERRDLLNEIQTLLALAGRRHIILVGPEGAGKRTLARSLALPLAEGRGGLRSLVEINESALLEDPLAAIRAGLRRAGGGILIVPFIGRFFSGRNQPAQFPAQVERELHKALLGDQHAIIGTATVADYERIAQARLVRERTNRLDVPPTTVDETIAVLNYHRPRLEREYGISVEREALDSAARLANQYIKTTALPGAALQLADRACALVKVAVSGQLDRSGQANDGVLSPDDVMMAASQITKVPVSKLNADELSKYANMVDHLHQRIIGQEEAVLAVSRAVKIARVGLRDPKQPIGSFLFLGPSGVGKTELAKALADFMFGSEAAMIALDMTEYQDESSVNRLIGAPPGYVGYEGGGQLTDFVRERPYTVVLLDEIEKANARVLDVLLQVMEEGRLTDGQGRLTTFSETVVIMTSNLGAAHMQIPFLGERERELVMGDVRRFLRPEFINRIDEIILFHQLTPEQLALILDLMLKKEIKLAAGQGLTLDVTPAARRWLLAQNNEPQFGARPLRRIIARHLRQSLADYLLTAGAGAATIAVDADANGLSFSTTPRVAEVQPPSSVA